MLKSHPKAQYFTWLILLLILPLPLVIMLNTSLVDNRQNLIIYDFGIIAYVWWLGIVYLSTRPQWLDRLIGLPAMYFIHAMLGVLALVAAFFHRQFAFSMHEEIKVTGDWAWYIAIFMIAYASFFMSGWLVDRFPLARRIKSRLQKIFSHELSVWLHRLSLVMIFLIWLHVHVIARIAVLTPFMMLFDLYTVYFLGVYAWKKLIIDYEGQIQGTVLSNTELSKTVQELHISIPQDQTYQAGDFYFVRFKNRNISKEKHPFSVASAPSQSPHELTFMIQSVGDFTSKIRNLPEGTPVVLEGPFGRFNPIVEELDREVPLVLYGLGSGIAPLMSMAKEYKDQSPLHIIWSAKNEEEFYFDQDFKKLADQAEQLIYHGKAHRFSLDELQALLTSEEIKKAHFFVVGSASALLPVETNLEKLGVPRKHIHDERLTM